MISKIDPTMIDNVVVLSGPYGVQYGPGLSFIRHRSGGYPALRVRARASRPHPEQHSHERRPALRPDDRLRRRLQLGLSPELWG